MSEQVNRKCHQEHDFATLKPYTCSNPSNSALHKFRNFAYLLYCISLSCGSKVHSFVQWVAANCAALPTANAGQYATSHCKPLLFWFPCKGQYINARTFSLWIIMCTCILESARSGIRPARSSPSSVVIYTRAVRSVIPSDNHWPSLVFLLQPQSSVTHCLSHIQSLPSTATFRQRLKTFLFQQSFPDIVLNCAIAI